MKLVQQLVLLSLIVVSAFGTTPGQHQVVLTWIPGSSCTAGGCTYNLYRGSSAGVCNGNPTPYAKNIANPTFTDTVGLADGQTIFYNVSEVKNGGESACDGELQVQIPVLPSPPSGLSGTAQ